MRMIIVVVVMMLILTHMQDLHDCNDQANGCNEEKNNINTIYSIL